MRLQTKPIADAFKDLQFTPYVYINSSFADEHLALVIDNNTYVLNCKSLDVIEKNNIHMNQLIRKNCGLTLDSIYDYNMFHGKIDPIDNINIMIDVTESREISVDIEEMISYIKTNYKNLVVRLNDIIPVRMNDTTFRLTINNYELFTHMGIENHGMITNLTVFEFDKKKPNILFKNDSSTKEIFNKTFDFKNLEIGGLNEQLTTIFRKVFVSRLLPSNVIEKLEIKHIKGLILYGPPGTGKTLIARQLSKSLKAKSIKIINGPELVSSFVGKSEENVRNLFIEPENDIKNKQDGLHVIVFDEFDSLCKRRGEVSGVSGDVNDKIVTQLLSKIDGVESLNNILLIGMTNRIELIDPAILRPGRFEVHVEIALPDENGREEILNIHTKKLKENKCIEDVDIHSIAAKTKNYTGAELEGIVRDARSYAINTLVDMDNLNKKINMEDIMVNMSHFEKAIANYTPKYGKCVSDLKYYIEDDNIENIGIELMDISTFNNSTQMLKLIEIDGETQIERTSKSVLLARETNYPYIRVISNNDMIGYSENSKTQYIKDIFNEAYNSPQSVIVIDNLDSIVEYFNMNGTMRMMFSLYNSLKTLMTKKPTKEGHKLLIIINADELCVPIKNQDLHL